MAIHIIVIQKPFKERNSVNKIISYFIRQYQQNSIEMIYLLNINGKNSLSSE